MKSCRGPFGSPLESSVVVTILPNPYWAIKTLSGANTGEVGGTNAIPSGPPPIKASSVVEVMSNVPLPSGAYTASYHPPLLYETSFILPAPGNPGGTKPIEPTEARTPTADRSMTLSGAVLPSLLCSSSF